MVSFTGVSPSSFRRPSLSQGSADAIPILVNDTYHLFHLTTPPHTIHHPERLRSYWSHLRSRNLIQWSRDDSPSIVPDQDSANHDADGAWTGSAVIGPDGNMHIFYTGYNLAQNGKQVIIHAASPDIEGSSFVKFPEPISISNETVANLALFEDIDFRDPYVLFNQDECQYWMLVATRLLEGPYWTRGCLALLTSTDLNTWHLEPEPFFAPNDMFCPECPELFTLPNGHWYLVYSRFSSPHSGTVYRMSDSPRGPFRKPKDGSAGRWDGRRWYAAKSCPKAGDPSKRVYFGWIADRCEEDKKWMWGGDMAYPRQVTATVDGSLRIEPVEEILSELFRSEPIFQRSSVKLNSLGAVKKHFLYPTSSDSGANSSLPTLMSFKFSSSDVASFGVLFHADADLSGYWLRFTPAQAGSGRPFFTISLSLCPPSLDDFWADQYKLYLPREVDGHELVRHDNVPIGPEEAVKVLMIGDTLEVFVGGRAISYRFQPKHCGGKGGNLRYGLFVDDGEVTFNSFFSVIGNSPSL
ncbi:glycosyl hydrolase [Aspergillus caelatus]|uniref:beta-fructofuranosidase n=1 Tax=Aspergillus caelatus TaxID=61420 RepID=A0A5N7A6F9_9EURO|nr:glycosyl hydrolase [Aspergillus caelatus]KAE8365457.1 glycosyl hydrolase [Aspergillus caelatus]